MSEITKCIVVNLGALIKFSDGGEGRLPTSYGRIRLNPDSLICIAGKVKRVEKTGPVLTLHVCPIDSYDVGYSYVVVVVSAFKAMLQWNVGDVVKIVGKLELSAAPIICELPGGVWKSMQPLVVQATRKHSGFPDTEDGKNHYIQENIKLSNISYFESVYKPPAMDIMFTYEAREDDSKLSASQSAIARDATNSRDYTPSVGAKVGQTASSYGGVDPTTTAVAPLSPAAAITPGPIITSTTAPLVVHASITPVVPVPTGDISNKRKGNSTSVDKPTLESDDTEETTAAKKKPVGSGSKKRKVVDEDE